MGEVSKKILGKIKSLEGFEAKKKELFYQDNLSCFMKPFVLNG